MTHRKLSGDSIATRVATRLSTEPIPATTAAQRIAVFHST